MTVTHRVTCQQCGERFDAVRSDARYCTKLAARPRSIRGAPAVPLDRHKKLVRQLAAAAHRDGAGWLPPGADALLGRAHRLLDDPALSQKRAVTRLR